MRIDQRCNMNSMRMSEVVRAACEDVQLSIGQQHGKPFSYSYWTDRVCVAPQQQGRRLY